MIRLLWAASTSIRSFMRRYMPTNVLLDAIRTRRGLKWGVPAMLLAIPYLLVANLSAEAAASGGPGWLLRRLWRPAPAGCRAGYRCRCRVVR